MRNERNKSGKLEVMDFIRQGIKQAKFKPGERVKETFAAETLGLSRAPVREALLELSSEGLIQITPNKGAYVAWPTAKEIMERSTLCGVLEGYALASTLHLFKTPDFRRLETSLNIMEHIAATSQKVSLLMDEEVRFHHGFLAKVHDEFLLEFIDKCNRMFEVLLAQHWTTVYSAEAVHRRHQELYELVRQGDPAAVEKRVREHYEETGSLMSRFGCDMQPD